MDRILRIILLAILVVTGATALPAATGLPGSPGVPVTPAAPGARTATFAPLPSDHELAPIWNDPDFARRMQGSYGFLSAVEPPMDPEDQLFYKEKIKVLLMGDETSKRKIERNPKAAIPLLLSRVKPGKTPQFDFMLGTLYLEQSDMTNAIKHFEAALLSAPDFRRAQKNLAFAYARSENYNAAIKPLLKTITLGGGDGKVFGILGIAYMNQGRFASAEAAYNQAMVFEPDNLAFKLGAVKCAMESANYDHALALLAELIKHYPEKEDLWTLQANLYLKKEQSAEAALSLETLRRLGKANAANLFLLGDLYMTQEARDLALSAYLEAMEKDGGKNLTKALRPAQILVGRGAHEEARKLFAKIREPGNTLSGPDELKLLKLESKVAMAGGHGDQAIATLEQIIAKDGLDGEALLLAGDYYARNTQPEKAASRYDTAAKLQGFEADAFVKHAQLLVQSAKYPEAVELLRKAQKAKPRDNVMRYLEKIEQLARAGRS